MLSEQLSSGQRNFGLALFVLQLIHMAQLLKYFVKVRASLSSSYNQKSFESGILSANILERASIQFEAMNVVITT